MVFFFPIRFYNDYEVRAVWDEKNSKWWFSATDIAGHSVDVGVVEAVRVKDGKRKQSQYEIDFIVNTGKEKIYIQSALNVDTEEKRQQETFSLKNSGDFFPQSCHHRRFSVGFFMSPTIK